MAIELIELFPKPGITDTDRVCRDLDLGSKAPADRPYVVLNMASTADGRATVDGRSGGIGDEADRALFAGLRTQVDAVMVGAGTLRAERYGRLVRDPELRRVRVEQGLSEDPLAVVVSGSLNLSADLPLIADPASKVIVFTNSGRTLDDAAADVRIERFDGKTVPAGAALKRLRDGHQVRSVLVEGGPTLNAELVADGLADELFLTFAPLLAGGGEAPTIVTGGQLATPAELELISVRRNGSYLFLRYRLR